MIYNLNIFAGTGNPVKITDLKFLWEAIHNLCIPITSGLRIVSGFQVTTDMKGITPGILVYNGVPYFFNGGTNLVDQYLYVSQQGAEPRSYEGGVTRNTYNKFIVQTSKFSTETALGVLVGQATLANINLWKAPFISEQSITGLQIANYTVGNINMQSNSIATNNIQPNSIINTKIADGAITPAKLNYAAPFETFGAKFFAVSFTGNSITSQFNTGGIFTGIQVRQITGQFCRFAIVLLGTLPQSEEGFTIPADLLDIKFYVSFKYAIAAKPTYRTSGTNFTIQYNIDYFDACPIQTAIMGTITGVITS